MVRRPRDGGYDGGSDVVGPVVREHVDARDGSSEGLNRGTKRKEVKGRGIGTRVARVASLATCATRVHGERGVPLRWRLP